MARTRERLDSYTLELQRHGLESVEREVRWLSELIDTERASNMTHLDDPDRPRRPPTKRSAPATTATRKAERPPHRSRRSTE
jgi:hypothetical protein